MICRGSKTVLLVAVSSIGLLPAMAQAQSIADDTVIEEALAEDEAIIVTGTRASLENAERIKRDSTVVVDGISADDISALPDASLSESLIRVSGVTANDGPRGPDAISIRGLGPDLSSTTVNGRLLATPNGGDRRISLAQLPTEGISGAYVQKTPDAATIEGGVAGTLDLRTIHPLDTKRSGLTLVARLLTQDNSTALRDARRYARFGARAEATYVGRFTDNFGVALTYAYLNQFTGFVGQQNDNWRLGTGVRADLNADGAADALPTNVGVTSNFNDVERHSVLGMVQWDASDAVRFSLDGLYVRDRLYNGPTRFFANNIFNGPLGAPASSTVDEYDTVQAFSGASALYRGAYNESRQIDQNYGVGLKVAVDKSPFKAVFDISFSEATRGSSAPQATIETDGAVANDQRRNVSYDFTDLDNPLIDFVPTVAEDYALSQLMDVDIRVRDTIKAARADFEYDPGSNFLKSIGFGFRVDRREHVTVRDQAMYSFANLAARPDLDSSYLQTPTNPFVARDRYFGGPGSTNWPYFDLMKLMALRNAPGVIVNQQFGNDVAGTFDVTEDTAALYAQANIESGGFSANAGLRYVITDTSVKGQAGTTPANVQDLRFDNSYKYLLPSVNLRYEFTPTVVGRLGYSETFSRQQFNDLAVSSAVDLTTIPTGVLTISRGNPNLRPFTSRGFDAGIEWYPDRSTSIAIAGYVKKLTNYLVATSEATTVELADGTVVPAIIQSVVNDPQTRDLKGVEVSIRKELDFLPGFLKNIGVQANFNYNKTDIIQTTTSLVGNTVDASADLFSKYVVNGQVYYSTPDVDLRVAYRYFSPYVRAFFNSYQEVPAGQIDVSGGVNLFGSVRLIGSVTNLTKSRMRRYVPDYRDPDNKDITQLNVYQGRMVTLGLRANF